jgi:deazaflavin-dependent oxidoreductase (nitroreductase family)
MPRLPGRLMQWLNDLMFRLFRHRLLQGARVLSLTTLGAKSGQERRTTVVCFPDRDDALLIVASAGGAEQHPAWFFNLARHPESVWVEVGGRRYQARPATLEGAERDSAWQRIIAQSPSFAGYETKTDRQIPVIRLTAI